MNKFLCGHCLKEKKTHERGNKDCRAPPCKFCGARHHFLLCDSVQEKKQLLKTKKEDSEEEEDDEEGYKDLDDQHICYLNNKPTGDYHLNDGSYSDHD